MKHWRFRQSQRAAFRHFKIRLGRTPPPPPFHPFFSTNASSIRLVENLREDGSRNGVRGTESELAQWAKS
jgi:hypothetical protein